MDLCDKKCTMTSQIAPPTNKSTTRRGSRGKIPQPTTPVQVVSVRIIIRLLSFICVAQYRQGAIASVMASGAHEAHFVVIDDGVRYLFNAERSDDEEDGDDLIHLPMMTRASVLRERNLLHLLEEEMDEDAVEAFAGWARNGGDGRRLGSSTNNDASSHHRELQEFSGEGTHFLKAYVGNPAQRRILAISSASDVTAFPCEGCTQCGPLMKSYLQSQSSSFLPMPCGRCVGGQLDDVCDESHVKCVARGYNLIDKSAWSAYEARDHFYVGGLTAENILESYGRTDPLGTDIPEKHGFPLVFGCQTEATGWYASQVQDGIVGFSMARTSLVNQMVFQDQLKYPRFCMCFEQVIHKGDDGVSAGIVTLGGYNPQILDHPFVYVQNTEKMPGTRYKVFVNGVYLREGGGQSIVPHREGQAVVRLKFDVTKFNEKNGGTILDSAVPLLVFDESIQQSFLEEWRKMVGSPFTSGKVIMTEEEVRALPTLIIQVKAHDGVDKSFNPQSVPNMAGDRDPEHPFDGLLAVPATNYMEYNPSTGAYRARISLDSKLGSFMGINVMHGHAYFYDLSKDRIGFAESYNCRPKAGLAGLVDDDMFVVETVQDVESEGLFDGGIPGTSPFDVGMPTDTTIYKKEDNGTCVTATCISFVTLGYCIVFIVLGVAYRKYRPRDRSKQFDEKISAEDDSGLDDETTPVFEWNLQSTGGGSSSGRSSFGRSNLENSQGSRGSFV